MKKQIVNLILTAAAIGAAAVPVFADTKYKLQPHSDSAFARELYRMGQASMIKAAEAESKGTAAESLWHAEALEATWDEIGKNRTEQSRASQEYLTSLQAYLDSQGTAVDGTWALDNAKFIFAKLSEPVINRMEYWSNSEKDRAALAPMAQTADRLLKTSVDGLAADLEFLGSTAARARFTSEDAYNAAYMRAFGATVEVEYYNAWAKYFLAMSIKPGEPGRSKLLEDAAKTLDKWADDADDNGVNSQALLLRGKAYSESGKIDKAVADLQKAQDYSKDVNGETVKAPGWVVYQAKYQTIVARINGHDFKTARSDFDTFKAGLKDKEALVSADMLGYRIAWAEADTMNEGPAKQAAQLAAMKILSGIIEQDPRYRDLVFDQLAAQISDSQDLSGLMPMQQLAMAYSKSTGQKGETPESRKNLQLAVKAALAVKANKNASANEKLEATFLAGICSAVLNQLMDAAKYNLEFAEGAPKDPRAKQLTELALQQIGELRKIAGTGGVSPELRDLQDRALALATGKFNDPRWTFAAAVTHEENGRLAEAYKAFDQVKPDDKNYLDARYRMIRVSLARLNQLTGKATNQEITAAANDLFAACTKYEKLLESPPAGVPEDIIKRAQSYRNDISIIELAAALNPAVKRSDVALAQITKLEKVRDELPDATKGALLRYKIQAYQQDGHPEKAIEVVKEYAKTQGTDAAKTIANFVYTLIDEINQAETRDPEEAKKLASYAVDLLGELIKSAEGDDTLKTNIYDFQKLQSDMMVRAHRSKEAIDLAKKLQEDKPQDLFNFMTEARAIYAGAEETGNTKTYAEAQDYFTRILPKLEGDSYWECYLHIIQCKEKINGANASAEIKKSLSDLKAVYGSKVGGTKYKDDFEKLMTKYAVQ